MTARNRSHHSMKLDTISVSATLCCVHFLSQLAELFI